MTASTDKPPRNEAARWPRRPPRAARFQIGAQEFVKKGLPRFDPHDPYYFAVSLGWRKFTILFVAAELAINTLFALLYMLQPTAIANKPAPGFLSAFFFSLETLATVGYGEMYPGSLYGHVISSLEILVGTVFTAIMTGLLFVRFSKPKAKVAYATNPVVAMNNGQRTLMLRVGNARADVLHHASFSMYVLLRSTSAEGQRQVNVVEMPLQRSRVPIFAILFTMMHVIDEASPLFGLDSGSEVQALRLFVSVSAKDPAMGQEVSDLHTFAGSDIRYGMRYVDAVHTVSETKTVADYALLSQIEPDTAAAVRQTTAEAVVVGAPATSRR